MQAFGRRLSLIMLAGFLSGVLLLLPSLSVVNGDSSSTQPRLTVPAYRFEMHWGFLATLAPDDGDAALLLPMDGEIVFSDGNSATVEGLHLISALLFEHGGAYSAGRDDEILAYQEMGDRLTWRSSTTSDWDGIGVAFRYTRGTDPAVSIRTSQWQWSGPLSQLRKLNQIISVGERGQQLEVGPFFTLSYKVYDLMLVWGYNKTLDLDPSLQSTSTSWDGSVSISTGGIRFVAPLSFEPDDSINRRPDLSSMISWYSTTSDSDRRRLANDALTLNFIVPRGAEAIVKITFKQFGERTFKLPFWFKDIHSLQVVDDQGHYVHSHLHWCAFKKS